MLKVKIYQTIAKPAMLYGAECWVMRKKYQPLNKNETRMLCWIQGISLKDHIKSEEIQIHQFINLHFLTRSQ